MSHLRPGRRFSIALCAVAISALCFRPQVANALVTRGDEFLARGDAQSARTYYQRAMLLDANSAAAVDRFVFAAVMAHVDNLLPVAVAAASAFLSRHSADATVLEDRALCLQRARRFSAAAADFAAAARISGSARDSTFAGWAELRAGNRARARQRFEEALSQRRDYAPAKAALRKVHP